MKIDWESLVRAVLAGTAITVWAAFVTFGLVYVLYKMGIINCTCGG